MRDKFHSLRQQPGLSIRSVQFVDLFVEVGQRGFGYGPFAQQHDPFHDVIIVEDRSVFFAGGSSELPQPHLGSLHDVT